MRTFDFSPLYRSTIGFDNLGSLLESVSQWEQNQPSYPPYNIELLEEDRYRITMALAGFDRKELDIKVENQMLTVSSNRSVEEQDRNYLHQGIAARNFERRFRLADHVRVTGASLENGLLHIELRRELPEAMKPRTIEIETGEPHLIDVDDKATKSKAA